MTGNPPSTGDGESEAPTRILLRGDDGKLRLPSGVSIEGADHGSTLTQSFRVRNLRARRQRQALIREENLVRPKPWVDAAFPTGVAVLVGAQPAVNAALADSWWKAGIWLVVPATIVFFVVSRLSRQLDRSTEA